MTSPNDWIKSGVKLCTMPLGKKAPVIKDWQNNPIKKWDGSSNLGLIHYLNQTCALDIDDFKNAILAFESVNISLFEILSTGVGIIGNPDNRAKAIFKVPTDFNFERVSLSWDNKTVFELRAGHCQDVIYGTHPEGYQYQLKGDLLDIPDLPEEILNIWANWNEAKKTFQAANPNYKDPEKQKLSPRLQLNDSSSVSVIDAFNDKFHPFQLLLQYGYTQYGDRLLSPWSKSRIPALKMFENGRNFWSWSSSCPFGDELPHDAFDVFCFFEANGDLRQAVKLAAGLLDIQRNNKISVDISNIIQMPKLRNPDVIEANTVLNQISNVPPIPLFQEILTWFAESNGATPAYALTQATLSFLSAIFSRRYAFDAKSPINLYLGCHTDSVAQLSSLISILQSAVADCGERKILRSDAFSSSSFLKKALSQSPRLYWVTSDYCSAVAFSAKQNNSRGYDSAANTIRTVYSGGRLFVDADSYGTRHNSEDIYSPALTIMALMASGEIHKITKKEEYDRGTLQQLMLIEGGRTVIPAQRTTSDTMPEHLIEIFKLAKPGVIGGGNLAGVEAPGVRPIYTQILSSVEWRDYDKAFLDMAQSCPQWGGIALGWAKIFKRICGVLAVCNNLDQPVVTDNIVAWAYDWVLHHLKDYFNRLQVVGSDQGEPDLIQKILAVTRKFGPKGATQREIRDQCRPFRRLSLGARNELIEDMVFDGIITQIKANNTFKYVDPFWTNNIKKFGEN